MKGEDTRLVSELRLEVPKVEAEILDVKDIEEMSLSDIENAKKYLELKRKQVQVHLDGKKLQQAITIMKNTDLILDKMYNGIIDGSMSCLDIKLLSDAYEKMNRSLNMLSRFDTMDSNGGAAMINIEVRW